MSRLACGGWALMLALPCSALAQQQPPRLLAPPSGEQIASHYPLRALRADLEGRVVLECRVTRAGRLADCRPVQATPEEAGFEDAALALADDFRFAPAMVDGEPTDSGVVRVPIVFALGDDETASGANDATPTRQLCPDGQDCVVIE